jgi:hypothetical protein
MIKIRISIGSPPLVNPGKDEELGCIEKTMFALTQIYVEKRSFLLYLETKTDFIVFPEPGEDVRMKYSGNC